LALIEALTLHRLLPVCRFTPSFTKKRKSKLEKLLSRSDGIRFSERIDGDGKIIFGYACKLGLEGIVSKRRELSLPNWSSEKLGKNKNS
jgi:hypothetical protein